MPSKIDLTGRIFEHLTVLREAERRGRSKIHWVCLCKCGNMPEVSGSNLTTGASKTCGCSLAPEDLTGKVFGSWTVTGSAPRKEGREYKWTCLCVCGTVGEVDGSGLRLGRSLSCGCRINHGYRWTRTYAIWANMKDRITNPHNSHFKSYGGRGLTLDPDWHDFRNFLRDMGEVPKGLTIERTNNELGYSKANCIWADLATQARNKRTNIWVEYKGQSMVLKDATDLAGIRYGTVYNRIYISGQTPAEALEEPSARFSTKPL